VAIENTALGAGGQAGLFLFRGRKVQHFLVSRSMIAIRLVIDLVFGGEAKS
jgi:hypothetical protein